MTTGDGRPDPADPPGDDGPSDDDPTEAGDATPDDEPTDDPDGEPSATDGSDGTDGVDGTDAADDLPRGAGTADATDADATTADGPGPDAASSARADEPTAAPNGGAPTGTAEDDGPAPVPGGGTEHDTVVAKFRYAEQGPWRLVRELVVNLAIVALVGLLLFGVSGVWPPMVAVESGSMEPHMTRGDLVFVTAPERFPPGAADGSGIVTYQEGQAADYRSFGDYGSVIVFDNPRRGGPPVIHRARFYVEAGENWYSRADPEYMSAGNCAQLAYCPAPEAGYITKGDNNAQYDQVSDISGPVQPSWITGVARLRIPFLGWIRLLLSWTATPTAAVPGLAAGALAGTVLAGRGRGR